MARTAEQRGGPAFHVSAPRLTGYAAMAVALGLSIWLVADRGGGRAMGTVTVGASATASSAASRAAAPKALDAARLRARVESLGRPVFWAGTGPGGSFDVSRIPSGGFVVRYLPPGASPAYTGATVRVATIPFANAFAATEQLAAKAGASSKRLPDGGLVYYRADRPSTYVAYPSLDYVIEVDAPLPEQARQLALAGSIRPVVGP